MDWALTPQVVANLLTLTALEIVLGIDNLVFIALLAGRLPAHRQGAARRWGLVLALVTRLLLLVSIAWIVGLTAPVFTLFDHSFSWRDLILAGGGLFLLYKSTREIHQTLEGEPEPAAGSGARAGAGFVATVVQIGVLDVVFSLDSVITAVGMSSELWVMMAAVVAAILVMLVASGPLSAFVHRHPTVKMLALSFLLLIGMTLIADGLGFHVPKGYIYAAIGFSVGVEALNQLAARRRSPQGSTPGDLPAGDRA